MSSKSKELRIEQRQILEKKLDLRLQQLAAKGISQEKAQSDPLVKNLKAKIREANVRIKAADKQAKLTCDLAEAKAQKLSNPVKDEAPEETSEKESKPKKKAAAEKETKKKSEATADGDAPKKTRKKKEEAAAE